MKQIYLAKEHREGCRTELHYAETAADSREGISVELRNEKERVWTVFRKQK